MEKVKETYLEKMEIYLRKKSKLDEQEAKRQAEVDRAFRSIGRIAKKRRQLSGPSWKTDLVRPIAEHFSSEFGWKHEIYGPFGLRAEISIYWTEPESSGQITKKYSLSLVPGDLEKGELWYETGEKKGAYKKGTIGEINGMNNKTLPLPEDMDEIRKLILASELEYDDSATV